MLTSIPSSQFLDPDGALSLPIVQPFILKYKTISKSNYKMCTLTEEQIKHLVLINKLNLMKKIRKANCLEKLMYNNPDIFRRYLLPFLTSSIKIDR